MPILLDAESTVQPGHVLGDKYRVESVLGMGGMGVVVATRHVKLNERFALKLMRREAAKDEESVERFLREARAAVQLKSQHCVRVLDVGKLDNGSPYMVMELLVGKDLGALVRDSGARSPAEAVDYVLQACEGLAEAHSLGIIHRDVKPQNLFLTRGVDGMPLVKVLDFGLAKSMKTTPEIRALTHSAAVMGSPTYMSPEQMRASRDVDARSDMWSLAVCLYELLTGRAPFEGATYPELCSAVLNKPPSPMPSDIPRGLSRVITRCLHKDPRRRYVDVAELAEALAEFASTPGAAARIRAVLDAPRLELDPFARQAVHDPTADTKTAASIDTSETTKRRENAGFLGGSRGMRRAWIVSVAVGATLGLAIARWAPPPIPVSFGSEATPEGVASPPPQAVISPIIAPIASAPPLSPPPPPLSPPPPPSPPATATAANPAPSRPARARGIAGHAAPRATPATTAQPKPSVPVLVPKTTEF